MAKHHNPKVVTTNLLLNLDFKNSKRFSTNLGTNLVQDPTYNASTWGTFATYKTTGIDAPDGSKNAVRMTSVARSVTYTLTTNVVTVTMQAHGFSTGQNHYFDFTSGTGVDGYYNVTVVDANTFTIPVTAANGSGNVTVYGRTGMRVTFTPFTPNGTDTYTMSFWARLVSGTYIKSGDAILCDFNDSAQKNYTSDLVVGKWVYITHSVVPTSASKYFVDLLSDTFTDYVIDFWGVKLENQTTDTTYTPIKDTVGDYTFNVYRPQYSTLSDSDITFTRTTTANTPVTFTNIIGNGTTTVVATLASTTGWTAGDAFRITGATASTALNDTWVVNQVVSSTQINFVTWSTIAAGTYTTGLGTITKSSKWGGMAYTTGTGSLTATNFLYNDHTFELWFRINDINPSNLDNTEAYSILAGYSGWHCGFVHTNNKVIYLAKDGASNNPEVATWTLGTSGTQIVQGNWYQIVMVKSGNIWTPYVNGSQLGTGTTTATSSTNHGVSDYIHLGSSAYKQRPGSGRWIYYGKSSIANMKMYNRALTAAEISQNFNALRGRFGI